MSKVNVNAFGVVNLKLAACALNSTSFQFRVSNHQSTIFNGPRLIPQDLRALHLVRRRRITLPSI